MIEPNSPKSLKPQQYERLRAEAAAPYRGLRQFIYISVGASGFIGAFVFFFQLLAGRDIEQAVPNFAIQLGVIGLMVFLWKWENSRNK
jgi:Low psii accumulation1 / Rep27